MLNISPFNMLCVVLNLLILAALMKKFLYKPVLGIIAKRQELIDSQFAAAEAAKEEARQLKVQYETSLSDSREEQQRILTEAKAEAAAEWLGSGCEFVEILKGYPGEWETVSQSW